MDHKYWISNGKLTLRPICEDDLPLLMEWRNNIENSKYIRKIKPVTAESQKKWFSEELQNNNSITFGIAVSSVLIGSVSLYNITDSTCSFGRLMIGVNKGSGYGLQASLLAIHFAFNMLNVGRINAEVSCDNTIALKIYIKIGFVISERRYSEIAKMEEYCIYLDRIRFFAINKKIEIEYDGIPYTREI